MSAIPKVYSSNITSYDLLKSFAVIIMVIDHLGYYFFPEELWLRALGRIGFPVWFYLVGHASGRDIPVKLWGGAVILILLDAITGIAILPLNALVTIILIRLLIDPVMTICLKNNAYLWLLSGSLFLLILPTMAITEYGTLGLLTAMFGYMVRHKDEIKKRKGNDNIVFNFMLFAYFSFILMMQLTFNFNIYEFAFMAVGTFFVRIYLYAFFTKENYPNLTQKCGSIITGSLQFMGRNTLEIYVAHIIIFQLFALYFLNLDHLF